MATVQTLSLRSSYCERTLLLCGLSADGRSELYKFVNLATGELRETRVGIDDLRERQLSFLVEQLADGVVPYGLAGLEQLLPYFLHPHTFVQTASGELVVSFKQAPYMRLLRPDEAESPILPGPDELDFTRMLSSSNCEIAPDVVGLAATSAVDRLKRYAGQQTPVSGSVLRMDLRDGQLREVMPMPDFVIDTLHEVGYSPAGYFVGVDMNLSVDVEPDAGTGVNAGGDPFDLETYATRKFPVSQFFVGDAGSGQVSVHIPTAACAAHVDIDPVDPSVFYISCHNISKWENNVIVHGPGAVDRYRYRDGVVSRLGSFTAPDFFRITSQVLFNRDGRSTMAVTAYPNKLYLLDTATMTATQRIVLFTEETPAAPFICAKNSVAPLYLDVSDDGRFVFLTGSSVLFVVDLTEGVVVDQVQFCEPGSFLATAHIALLAPR